MSVARQDSEEDRDEAAAWGTLTSNPASGWILLAAGGPEEEALILDERGHYWWAHVEGRSATLLRSCPIEEAFRIREAIPLNTRRILHLE